MQKMLSKSGCYFYFNLDNLFFKNQIWKSIKVCNLFKLTRSVDFIRNFMWWNNYSDAPIEAPKTPEKDEEKEKFIYTKDEIADMILSFEDEISELKEQLQRTTNNVVGIESIELHRNLKSGTYLLFKHGLSMSPFWSKLKTSRTLI